MNEETPAGNDSAVWIKEYKQKLFEDECVQYFLNLEISDVEKPLLFTIKSLSNFESDLNNGTIPEELREGINRELGKSGWDGGDFSVKRDENKDEWIVRWELNVERDNKKKEYIKEFRLKKNGDNLGIYEQDSDFVRLVREAIMDVPIPDTEEEWKDFIKKTKEVREILAISHTIMDLLFFFSDYFPDGINDNDKEKEHKRRVRNYKNMLKLREKVNDVYIKKLKNFLEMEYMGSIEKRNESELNKGNIPADLRDLLGNNGITLSESPEIRRVDDTEWEIRDNDSAIVFISKKMGGKNEVLRVYEKRKPEEEPRIIIVVPMFPNITIQSFSIISELSWLRELIIREEEKSLRDNVELYLLFLNKPFLNILRNIDEKKREYFYDYRGEGRNTVKSVLNLNKLRIESFIKRYLTEYILKELVGEKDKLMKVPKWLHEHVKTVDQEVVIDNFWDRRIEVGKEEKEEGIVDDVVKCDDETLNEINKYLKQNKKVAERSYYLSDVGVPKILEFDLGEGEEKEATYKDLLYYLKEKIPENTLIIHVHTFRAVVLFNFYIDRIFKDGKKFLGWDSCIPMVMPPVIPIFQYISTLSKDYNYSIAKMYEKYVYGGDGGKYAICYLAHYLEFLFKDVLNTFKINIKGPQCDKAKDNGKCNSDTILLKEDCDRLKESGKCGTRHWAFECTSHWDEHAPCGTISDYLCLPMEIYYALEKIFLDIPYTFVFTKRSYMGKLWDERQNGDEKAVDTEFEIFMQNSEDITDNLKKHLSNIIDNLKEHLEKEYL